MTRSEDEYQDVKSNAKKSKAELVELLRLAGTEVRDFRHFIELHKRERAAWSTERASFKTAVAQLRARSVEYHSRIVTACGLLAIINARYLSPSAPAEFKIGLQVALQFNHKEPVGYVFNSDKREWAATGEIEKTETEDLSLAG